MEPEETPRMKRTKLTRKQGLVMVQYMNEHRDFACSKINDPSSRITMMKRWKELTGLLNNEGPKKTEEQWRKAWKDMKGKVRFKTSQMLSESLSPATMQGELLRLSKVDQMVLSIIGPRKSDSCTVTGASKGNACNVSQEHMEEDGHDLILPDKLPDLGVDPEVETLGNSQDIEGSQPAETSRDSNQPETGVRETLRGMQSKLNTFDGKYFRAAMAINEALTSMTRSHNELLKLKMESRARSVEGERLKLEDRGKFEAGMRTMVDLHRRMAVALEERNEGVTVSPRVQIQPRVESGNPSPIDDQDRGSTAPPPENLRSGNATTNRKNTEDVGGSLNDLIRWIDERMNERNRRTEHSIFGDYVVSEIQKLTDPYVLATAKNDIQKALFEASLKQIEIDRSKKSNQQLQRDEASNTSVPSSSAVLTVPDCLPSTAARTPEDPMDSMDTSRGQAAENSHEASASASENIIELS